MSKITADVGAELKTYLAAYLDLGLPVIPICPPTTKGMSLSRREQCKSLGKTPLIKGWPSRTVTTYEEVNEWLVEFPKCNFGLPLGNASHMVGIDIDGELGNQLLEEWSQGDLPETWTFTTKSGRRLLYAIPENLKVKKYKEASKEKVHEELALLGDGQQTVIPPSIHPTGYVYTWVDGCSPFDIPLPAMAPQWILDRMCSADDGTGKVEYSDKVTEKDFSEKVVDGGRNEQLLKLAGSLMARGNIPKQQVLDFLVSWNNKHCRPPLPFGEIERMVDYIASKETTKSKSNLKGGKKAKKEDEIKFFATPVAKRILEVEREKGYLWKYVESKGQFFCYDNTIGYWKQVLGEYLSQRVRQYLHQTHEDWDTTKHIKETIAALRDLLVDPEDDLHFDIGRNANLNILNLRNGMLDWKAGQILQHSPEHFSLIQLPVEYNPEATCPEWEKAIGEWIPDPGARLFIQEYAGYCLIPDTSYKLAVFLHGGGNNGKSMFLYGINKLLGEEATTAVPFHALADRFTITTLQNKLLNVADEMDGTYVSETGTLKALISGDPVKAEYKYGKSFFFSPVLKLLFSTNVLPKSGDRSEGWYSRFRFVVFPNKFAVNQSYRIHMHAAIEKELSGILNWAVEGLKRLNAQGAFTNSESMEAMKREYRSENDSAMAFVNECLDVEADGNVNSGAMYAFYCTYCEESGLKAVSNREFSTRLKSAGIEKGARPVPGDYRSRAQAYIKVAVKEEWMKDFNYAKGMANVR